MKRLLRKTGTNHCSTNFGMEHKRVLGDGAHQTIQAVRRPRAGLQRIRLPFARIRTMAGRKARRLPRLFQAGEGKLQRGGRR